MLSLPTTIPELNLVSPSPERDAPFALAWFEAPYGTETLRSMGNAEHEIRDATLEGEIKTLHEFIRLEKTNKQITWMLRIDNKTIGAAWIELTENHDVKPPSIHIMVGDKEYRGKGIGGATMAAIIDHIKQNMDVSFIYSRHLANNTAVAAMNKRLGFVHDGETYTDENGLTWQHVKLAT